MHTFFCADFTNDSSIINITDPLELSHCIQSLRKSEGQKVRVINGKGLAVFGTINTLSKKNIEIIIDCIDESKTELENEIAVAIGLLNKSTKLKLIIEKLTELGVSNIMFFNAEYSAIAGKKLKNTDSYAISALKQCKGKILPKINFYGNLKNILTNYSSFDVVYCHFQGENLFCCSQSRGKYLIVVGPEGGLSDGEISLLKECKGKVLFLGGRVLRAETAAIVAVSRLICR